MNEGWRCPNCGHVYAPWNWECSRCPAQNVTATGVTPPRVMPGTIPKTGTIPMPQPYIRPDVTGGESGGTFSGSPLHIAAGLA